MLFNSYSFAIFLPVVFFLYWFVANKNLVIQNALLLLASYVFYGFWDYRFLFLLAFSTFLDYFTGIKITEADNPVQRKFWFWLSICVNLGFLMVFKYYNFFAVSFAALLEKFGWHVGTVTLSLILPVGISFYTFHGLSYIIDIYKKKINAERNFIDYAVFVSFFPLLVAGPIERATHLLPQVKKARTFHHDEAVDGMRQILWGFVKKIVIADSCALYVNMIFDPSAHYAGSTHLLGAVLFAFQIYCDFSGYSDIAIGTGKLFGISLLRNFAFPYFSRDIAEFWRRWHISLSSWFRDYVYIPLGGNKGSKTKRIRNVFIIFLLSGFWHGANWTFIVWGLVNAIYFIPLMLTDKNRLHTGIVAEGKYWPGFATAGRILVTFFMTVIAWVFFRADNLAEAFSYLRNLFSTSLFSKPEILPVSLPAIILGFVTIEWVQRDKQHALQLNPGMVPQVFRWGLYFGLILFIYVFRATPQNFIYFKF